MFLNVTNHPSRDWSAAQLEAAAAYGPVRDFPFPRVSPDWDTARVCRLADSLFAEIAVLRPAAVLCQGEMTLTYQLVKRLEAAGIPVLCACSERVSDETHLPDGAVETVSRFVFRGFRSYAPEGSV